MERLTDVKDILTTITKASKDITVLKEIVLKLAEYEDIGLEPEEIKDIFIVISESQDEVDNAGISIGLLNDLIELACYRKTGLVPEEIKEHENRYRAYRNACGGMAPSEVAALKADRDYWRAEALKWCAKLGENRIMAEGGAVV